MHFFCPSLVIVHWCGCSTLEDIIIRYTNGYLEQLTKTIKLHRKIRKLQSFTKYLKQSLVFM